MKNVKAYHLPVKEKFVFVLDAETSNQKEIVEFIRNYERNNINHILLFIIYDKTNISWYKNNIWYHFEYKKYQQDGFLFFKLMNITDTNEQVIRAAFSQLDVSENYCVLDCRYHFWKKFYLKDFINENGRPYYIAGDCVHSCGLHHEYKHHEQIYNTYNMKLSLQKMAEDGFLNGKNIGKLERIYYETIQMATSSKQIPIGKLFYRCDINEMYYKIDCIQGTRNRTLKKYYIGYYTDQKIGEYLAVGLHDCNLEKKDMKLIASAIFPSICTNIKYNIRTLYQEIKYYLKSKKNDNNY